MRAHTRERTNERTNERTRTFVGTNESTSERGVKKPALDVSACDGARAGSFKKGVGEFSVRKCAAQRAWGSVHEGGNGGCAVQKKKGINYDDPAGILYVGETPRQYEILLRILHIDVSSHIVVYFAAGRFVYLPNPEPSDISIWCTLW